MSKNGVKLETMKNLLGDEMFQDILKTFSGERVCFPKLGECDRKERNRRIINERWKEAASVSDLAEKYQLSKSQIYKITEEWRLH